MSYHLSELINQLGWLLNDMVRVFQKSTNQPNEMALTICHLNYSHFSQKPAVPVSSPELVALWSRKKHVLCNCVSLYPYLLKKEELSVHLFFKKKTFNHGKLISGEPSFCLVKVCLLIILLVQKIKQLTKQIKKECNLVWQSIELVHGVGVSVLSTIQYCKGTQHWSVSYLHKIFKKSSM